MHRASRIRKLSSGVREFLTSTPSARQISHRLFEHAPTARSRQTRWITISQLDHGRDSRERVVILGSGWAGFGLARRLDPKKYQAVVVSPRSYFAFTPLLASTAVGTLEFRTTLEPVRSRRTKVDFFQGWADDVDFKNKKITIEEAVEDPWQGLALTTDRHAGESKEQELAREKSQVEKGKMFDLTYDKLVVAVGCYSQTFGTPGVKEHAFFLKDVGDARKIRNRLLSCFEAAALPTTPDSIRKQLLNFAVVGGGPTGIEFSAELHDLITEDLAKIYPELIPLHKITVYDVAPKVLPMFDEKLATYAMNKFKRDGIDIRTSHHVKELRPGGPTEHTTPTQKKDDYNLYTLKVKEEGETGIGMCVWSTGLMQNPFVAQALDKVKALPDNLQPLDSHKNANEPEEMDWTVKKASGSGSVLTDDRLRIKLTAKGQGDHEIEAIVPDVFALGDCGIVEGTQYPATAQVAQQKAFWLAKRLNKGDFDNSGFKFKNLGTLAYVGDWNALFQGGGGSKFGGYIAWVIWRGAYFTRTVSWRNKILIPIYWVINWLFGRDISRF
ncbi:FAD/NAD(P)-binding domain-containing protein [Sporormia fimetaria CBS 119925]|uniref:FAD/NAD(P)-binding domain-containing protein n=1 Tax=Sporormia fimetaria CBS 119925 TaxID=1340428 RepID=A0A6A6V829_9PLEO|nr:FAD/NAD(P)-binding domain-containing protein [Sporormia fimetaria CBS 119925]